MKHICKTLRKDETDLLSSLIGQKLDAISHDEFCLGNLCIEKVGLYVGEGVFAIHTSYEYLDFLWGKEGVSSLHFCRTDENGTKVLSANPPIKYVKQAVNDRIKDILIVTDSVEEFNNGSSMGTFTYDKAIIFVFENRQISIELDEWSSEMLAVTKSTDVLKKLGSLSTDWNAEDMDQKYSFKSVRTVVSLVKHISKVVAELN